MTLDSEAEIRHRLAAIADGPWTKALQNFALEGGPNRVGEGPIDLEAIPLLASEKKRSKWLAEALYPHFLRPDAVENKKEVETRVAFDEALTLPQLYELAVQTGYLPEENVVSPARRCLVDLLWSPAARRFVVAYDYLAIPMLANRVGVNGLGTVHPPEPNLKSELRFASFLAHFHDFYADKQIETWIDFLDDYIEEEDEPDGLWEYLRGKRRKAPPRTEDLLAGCRQFVSSLAGVFHVLDDDELGRFGLVHAYWLQRFFGYDVDASGYIKDDELWDSKDSWASTIASSSRTISEDLPPEIAEILRREFDDDVRVLKRTFDAVKSLVESNRKKAKRLK